jgi:hypothetical protein
MATAISPVSNDAKKTIEMDVSYTLEVELEGIAPILFHRWSVEGVEAKSKAAKGSKAKKEDDLETYVYRNDKGELAIPSEYLRMSMVAASKFKQDPRSPRKSAADLVKAGVVCTDELCSTGKRDWDFIDQRRVMIQRNGITRCRPALYTGWKIHCKLNVVLPQYLPPQFMHELIQSAGMFCDLGDFRPTYGRFQVKEFRTV